MKLNITISNEFKEILKKFKTESLVARILFNGEVPSEISFIDNIDYITISKNDTSKISYMPKERVKSINFDEEDIWNNTKRYQSRPGTFVGKIFKGISSNEIEKFALLFNAYVNRPQFTFKVVNGDDIKKYYHYTLNVSSGSLGASCMKHDHCQNYLDIYTKNPDNISMLLMFNEKYSERCIGRAILWNFGSYKIMDRIYTINDETYSFYFKEWASNNGFFYKSEQNWFNTLNFEKIGQSKKELKLEIDLPNNLFQKYPYMDTFKFIDFSNGKLFNYLPENIEDIRVLCGAEGNTMSNDYLIFDEISRVMRYRNDSAYITYTDTPLYTGRNNAQYSNCNDRWILIEHSTYNEIIGDYIFNTDNDHLNHPSIKDIIARRLKEREEYEAKMKSMMSKNKPIFGDVRVVYPTSRRRRDVSESQLENNNLDSNILDDNDNNQNSSISYDLETDIPDNFNSQEEDRVIRSYERRYGRSIVSNSIYGSIAVSDALRHYRDLYDQYITTIGNENSSSETQNED